MLHVFPQLRVIIWCLGEVLLQQLTSSYDRPVKLALLTSSVHLQAGAMAPVTIAVSLFQQRLSSTPSAVQLLSLTT